MWSGWNWFRLPVVTYALQILFALSIYVIECQKEVEYKKNKIR